MDKKSETHSFDSLILLPFVVKEPSVEDLMECSILPGYDENEYRLGLIDSYLKGENMRVVFSPTFSRELLFAFDGDDNIVLLFYPTTDLKWVIRNKKSIIDGIMDVAIEIGINTIKVKKGYSNFIGKHILPLMVENDNWNYLITEQYYKFYR